MKKMVRNNIFLIIIAFVLLLAVFLCTNDVVYAEEEKDYFVIKSDDGYNWTLTHTNDSFKFSTTGKWIDTVDTAHSVDTIFSNKIIEIVGTSNNYEITFKFPQNLSISLKDGIDKNVYTEEQDSDIVVCVGGTSIIGGVSQICLEYRLETETEYTLYEEKNGSLNNVEFIFGRSDIDVGQYAIRGYFYETFEFLDIPYKIQRRTSDIVHCTITTNENPPRDEIKESQLFITYGSSLEDIAASFNTSKGTYELAQSELNEDATLLSYVPLVLDEKQTYKFDYYPNNTNYSSIKDIELSLTIKKKDIEIFIDNVQKIVNDEIVDISNQSFNYYIKTSLVNDDSINDLGLTFYVATLSGEEVSTIDCNSSAEYRIKARFSNNNYNPISINATQNIISGGRYFVFPVGVDFEIDGAVINVNNMEGFIYVVPTLEEIDDLPNIEKTIWDVEYNEDDYKIKGIYSLYFVEQSNFTVTKYNQEFYMLVTPSESTRFLIYKKNGSYDMLQSDQELTIQYLSGEADDYIYLVLLEDIVYEESGIEWQHILMISLICTLFITFVIEVIIYKKRKWYLV